MAIMEADDNLRKDLNRATSFEDIRSLLERSVTRSGIADRDPVTGQFVPRTPTPATQSARTVEPAEEEFTRTVTIAGQEFTFTGASMEEVQNAIQQAREVAEAVRPAEQSNPGAFQTVRQRMEDAALQAAEDVELRLKFQRGEISLADYVERSGAIDAALAARGFDVEAAANKQLEQSWEQATKEFLAGSDWPGGQQNLKIIGLKIAELNLTDAPDKVAALRQAYAEMKREGIVMSVEPSEEQILEATKGLNPQELVQYWKEANGGDRDPNKVNNEFIRLHSSTGSSSSLFGK